jgi:hypothetical protein
VLEAETLDEMSTGYGDPVNLQKVRLPLQPPRAGPAFPALGGRTSTAPAPAPGAPRPNAGAPAPACLAQLYEFARYYNKYPANIKSASDFKSWIKPYRYGWVTEMYMNDAAVRGGTPAPCCRAGGCRAGCPLEGRRACAASPACLDGQEQQLRLRLGARYSAAAGDQHHQARRDGQDRRRRSGAAARLGQRVDV